MENRFYNLPYEILQDNKLKCVHMNGSNGTIVAILRYPVYILIYWAICKLQNVIYGFNHINFCSYTPLKPRDSKFRHHNGKCIPTKLVLELMIFPTTTNLRIYDS